MFVTVEGIDRSGKTTQAELLARALGPDTLLVREPGGTDAGERLRDLLRDGDLQLEPLAELLLFCAARAQLVAEVIRPALARGSDVVCDRFTDSSVAYQGVARELGVERVERLCELATGGLEPELTILLRINPDGARGRAGSDDDRFEGEGIEFQRAVARGYEEVAARHPGRVVVVEGEGAVEEVHARVMEVIGAVRR